MLNVVSGLEGLSEIQRWRCEGAFGAPGWSLVVGECCSCCRICYEILLWTLVILLHYRVLTIRRSGNGSLVTRLLVGATDDVFRELPHTTPYGYTQQQHHSITPATDMTITKWKPLTTCIRCRRTVNTPAKRSRRCSYDSHASVARGVEHHHQRQRQLCARVGLRPPVHSTPS